MNNLAWFCRNRNENYYNKLLKSTTTVRFVSCALSLFLELSAGHKTNPKYINDKSRGENKN